MAAVVLTAALVAPFQAHTATQLQDWEESWQDRAVGSLDVKLLDEWRDMRARHDWYFDPDPVSIARSARSPSTNSAPIAHDLVGGVEQWRSLVAYFWPAEHVDRMLSIMSCESHGVPTAVNPSSGAAGLFQIMPSWQRTWPGDYFDPWTNAAVAYQIWLSQGYAAWVCKG